MAKRVQFIRYKGVQIVHINWAGAQPAEVLEAMEDAKKIIAALPPRSVRTLTNVEGAKVDRAVTDALKGYVAHNKPFVLAGAVVGLNDLKMIAFNFVNRVTGRTLRAINTEEEAKDWLVTFSG